MGDDERASRQVEDVELDQVDTVSQRDPEGLDRVLRRERGRAPMADPQKTAVPLPQVDHGRVGR